MKRMLVYLLLVTLALATIASCGGPGIFYTVSREIKVDDRSLANEINVHSVLLHDGYYYAASRSLARQRKDSSEDAWQILDPPTGYDLCLGAAVFQDQLYAAFLSSDAAAPDTALFLYTEQKWSQQHVWEWDATDRTRITSLAADGSYLFAFTRVVATENTYGLDYSTDPDAGFISATVPQAASPFTDVVSDGGAYWLAGPGLFSATDLATGFTAAAEPAAASSVRNVHYLDDLGVLLAATSDGYVYAHTGSGWTQSNQLLDGADPVSLSDMVDVTIGQTRLLLVGTSTSLVLEDGQGYAEMDLTGATASSLAAGLPELAGPPEDSVVAENFADTQFREAVILDWLVDPADREGSQEEMRVYAGTAGLGLWRAAYDSEVGARIWSRE